MRLTLLTETVNPAAVENLRKAMSSLRSRRHPKIGLAISTAAKRFGLPQGVLSQAYKKRIENDEAEDFVRWWKSYRLKSISWEEYRDSGEQMSGFQQDEPQIDQKAVEPPATPFTSSFQSAPNRHMNRG